MIEYILARPFIALFCITAIINSIIIELFNKGIELPITWLILVTGLIYLISIIKQYSLTGLLIFSIAIISSNTFLHVQKDHISEKDKIFQTSDYISKIVIQSAFLSQSKLIIYGESVTNSSRKKIYLKISDGFKHFPLYYGDTLTGKFQLQPITNKPSGLFKSFDAYLINLHINYKSIPTDTNISTSTYSKYSLIRYSQIVSYKCITKIRNTVLNENYANLLAALLLGVKSDLDKNIKAEFTKTGTAHILAVSGLHLGMIYGILLGLLQLLRKIKVLPTYRILNFVLMLLFIWGFVLISGCGNSIIRAAIMITYLETGKYINRSPNTVNSLFCCGFLMIVHNPCVLYEIGFQLSFFAVLSIVLFNPLISRIYFARNIITKYIYEIISVSVAAQLLVSPLCIYYFHQFPVYFILGNLIWIPLSFILLALGILLIIGSFVSPKICLLLGRVCEILCEAGLESFKLIQYLPLANIEDLHLDLMQLTAYIASCLFIFFWLKLEIKKLLFGALIIFLLIPMNQFYKIQKLYSSQELILYSEGNKIQFEIRHNTIVFSSCPDCYLMKNYRKSKYITHVYTFDSIKEIRFLLPIPELVALNNSDCIWYHLEKVPCHAPLRFIETDRQSGLTNSHRILLNKKDISNSNTYACLDSLPQDVFYFLDTNNPLILTFKNE